MSERIFPRDQRIHNGRVSSALIAKCRKCGGEDYYIATGTKTAPTKYFQKRGWEIGRSPSMDVCYMCAKPPARVHKPKEEEMAEAVKADPPREMSRDDRRIIFAKIDEIYVGTGYQAPWTDTAVAKDLGVPAAWVAKVRDEMFGPEGSNPEIDNFLKELAALRKAGNDMNDHAKTLAGKIDGYFSSLKDAEATAAKIAKAVGK